MPTYIGSKQMRKRPSNR